MIRSLRNVGEDLRPVVLDDDEIFDPDPAEAGQVDAGLDRDDVADRERAPRLLGEARILVHEEADAVAEPVPEGLAEACRLDLVAGRRVDARTGRTGPDGLEPGELSVEADLVGSLELFRKRPGCEGPRAVRAVAVDHAARVDDHRLAALDAPAARHAVRLGRIRPRRDEDRERDAVRVRLVQERLEPPRELLLGPADEPTFVGKALERDVRDVRGPPNRVQLLLVLDDAELLHEPIAWDRLHAAGVQARVTLEAERRGLEADRP